jgi:hypothetical protein
MDVLALLMYFQPLFSVCFATLLLLVIPATGHFGGYLAPKIWRIVSGVVWSRQPSKIGAFGK